MEPLDHQERTQEEAERERREYAQNMKIDPPTRASGIGAIALMPKDVPPSGPTPAQLRSIALVKEAMELGEEVGESLPSLHLGSESD